jgi:hypothetical protein
MSGGWLPSIFIALLLIPPHKGKFDEKNKLYLMPKNIKFKPFKLKEKIMS